MIAAPAPVTARPEEFLAAMIQSQECASHPLGQRVILARCPLLTTLLA